MIGITALTYDLPDSQPVTATRASERSEGYWYLANPSTDFCLPFGSRKVPREWMDAYAPEAGSTARVANAGVRAGDMAVNVARKLRNRLAPDAWKRIDVVLYCYTTTDAAVFSSIPARLQHELDLKTAFPLAVTQADCCGFFTALRCARAFIEGLTRARSVLIVTADKWLFPFVRVFGSHCTYGDAAAAVIVEAADGLDADRALMVECVEFSMASACIRPFGSEPAFKNPNWGTEVGTWLRGALGKLAIDVREIDLVASPDLNQAFAEAVHRTLGVPDVARVPRAKSMSGFASTADPIIAVAASAAATAGVRRILAWGAGLNGEAGFAVLRTANTAQDWHVGEIAPAGGVA